MAPKWALFKSISVVVKYNCMTSLSNIGDEHLTPQGGLPHRVYVISKIGIIVGLRSRGYFAIKSFSGEKMHDSAKHNKLKLVERAKTLMLERREERIPLHLEKDGVSCARI